MPFWPLLSSGPYLITSADRDGKELSNLSLHCMNHGIFTPFPHSDRACRHVCCLQLFFPRLLSGCSDDLPDTDLSVPFPLITYAKPNLSSTNLYRPSWKALFMNALKDKVKHVFNYISDVEYICHFLIVLL